jgi:hypothetical protein
MADMKLEKFMWVDPKLSPEKAAEVKAVLEKQFLGAGQAALGEGRADFIDRFMKLISSDSERVKKLESEISKLHGMEKFERFRTQLLLLCIDIFQSGMYFAVADERAIENEWDLARVLGYPPPQSKSGE